MIAMSVDLAKMPTQQKKQQQQQQHIHKMIFSRNIYKLEGMREKPSENGAEERRRWATWSFSFLLCEQTDINNRSMGFEYECVYMFLRNSFECILCWLFLFFLHFNQASSFITFHVCTLLLRPMQMLCILDSSSDKTKQAGEMFRENEREEERERKTHHRKMVGHMEHTAVGKKQGIKLVQTDGPQWFHFSTANIPLFDIFRVHASYCVQYVCVLCVACWKTQWKRQFNLYTRTECCVCVCVWMIVHLSLCYCTWPAITGYLFFISLHFAFDPDSCYFFFFFHFSSQSAQSNSVRSDIVRGQTSNKILFLEQIEVMLSVGLLDRRKMSI